MKPGEHDYSVSETYEFVIVCITDAGTNYAEVWSRSFTNAIDAVKCYAGFSDHSTCVLDRVVTLVEPNGKAHTKIFKYPYGSEAAYEAACQRLREPQPLSQSNQG